MEKADIQIIYELSLEHIKDIEYQIRELERRKKFFMKRKKKLSILVNRYKKQISVHEIKLKIPIKGGIKCGNF